MLLMLLIQKLLAVAIADLAGNEASLLARRM